MILNRRITGNSNFGGGRILAPLVLLGMVILLAACGAGESSTGATPTPLPTPIVPEKPTYTVERGTVVKSLEFTGRVSPVREQELFFKADGFVSDIFFGRGDEVVEGALLAELEIGELQNRLAQQGVALETAEITLAKAEQSVIDQLLEAQINLEKLQLQAQREESSESTSRYVSAQVGLQGAERELAAAQEAYDVAWQEARDWELQMREPACLPGQGGLVPCSGQPLKERLENEREATEWRLANAQASLRVARADYYDASVSAGAGDLGLLILEKDIQLAESRIEQLGRGADPLLELAVERAQLDIENTERLIGEAQLVAPFGGRLLSVSHRPGDFAGAFERVMVLADPGQLEITAELGSDQLSEMSVGQPATIRLRGRPGDDFSGSVRQLPYPYGGGTAEAQDEDSAVRIALDDPDTALELGELATVIIILEEKEAALWLPPAAFRTFQGRTFVVVQAPEGQRRVDVRTGIESEDRWEIVEGLEEGEIVIGP